MPDNRIVVYKVPARSPSRRCPIRSSRFPPRSPPRWDDRKCGPRRHPQVRVHQHLRLPTSTWSAAGPPRRSARPSATRSPARSSKKVRTYEFLEVGDICSVPFNIACGRCRNCREGKTGICLNVNPARAGSAYGYVDMGGWLGGQADYVMVPFADFNLLKFPDRDAGTGQDPRPHHAVGHLPDRVPRRQDRGRHHRFDGVRRRGGPGRVWPRAYSAHLLGAAVVIVGDLNADRLAQARSFGCETVDISADATLEDQIAEILNTNEVDCAVDAVGFEASGHGQGAGRATGRGAELDHGRPPGPAAAGHPRPVRDR